MKLWEPIHLYTLQRNQWKSRREIVEIQNSKLKRLIDHSYRRVPYFRRLFDSAGIKPIDIETVQDLPRIPVTSRKTIHNLELKEKMACGIDPKTCKISATSGTTGIPLKIYFTSHDATMKGLSWARVFLSRGMKPWHRMVAFIGQQNVRTKKSWYEHFGLWRRSEISAWAHPDIWIERIQELKPDVLIGYVMTLKILGEALEKHQIRDINPRIIFHSSAVLDPFSRQFLESIFSTKIVDVYGSDEAGCIAWQCDTCSGYHLSSDMTIVEILKNGEPVAPGEEGEVVITNLHSYAMPFIRYAQGDVAVLSPENPRCGRGLPLLERIMGRTDDFIVLKNGEKISPHPFYHCIDPIEGIRRWRIVQDSPNRITVEIEPEETFHNATSLIVRGNLEELVKDQLDIDILPVDTISIDPSSKFRAVSSTVGRFH